MLTSMGRERDTGGRVLGLAGEAAAAGLDGVGLLAPLRSARLRRSLGSGLPDGVAGYKAPDDAAGDQARVGSRAGGQGRGGFLVGGRSVTERRILARPGRDKGRHRWLDETGGLRCLKRLRAPGRLGA